MVGHVEVEHFPAAMLNHEEHEQNSQPDGRSGEGIDRYNLTKMVTKFSRLGWRRSPNGPKKPKS